MSSGEMHGGGGAVAQGEAQREPRAGGAPARHGGPGAGSLHLVVIGGAPRSGTTLVQNMLDCHPEVHGGPEFLHLVDIVGLRNRLIDSVVRKWISSFCSAEDVDRRIRRLIVEFLGGQAEAHGARILSEKSPENVLVFGELSVLLPEAKFVWVVRDPRAVIASLLEVGRRAREKGVEVPRQAAFLDAAVSHVRQRVAKGFEFLRDEPGRVHVVRYEDLVSSPRVETERLCAFLGIDWSETMLRPSAVRHAGEEAITRNSDGIWYDRASFRRDPTAAGLGKWRKALGAADQLRVCEEFVGLEGLRGLGYDLAPESLDPGVLRKARRALGLRRARRRVRGILRAVARRLGI